jgi:hypothetical protein
MRVPEAFRSLRYPDFRVFFAIAFVFLLLPLVLRERSLSPAEGVAP